jgi:Tfp pilus assembly protein PilN
MRAVNLLPADSPRRGGTGGISLGHLGPVHLVLGVLVIVLAYVTLYVLTSNTISQRKSQLAALHLQVSQEQAQTAGLTSFTQFQALAQQRAETVRQIAASRFDWHGALSDLSKVMPANSSLQSLVATVAPGASVSGAGGSTSGSAVASGSVRGDISAPAFELKGCTATQDDVARLISRLRLINGVQRVTLEDSSKAAATAAGTSSSGTAGTGAAAGTCAGNGPGFDLVVFFQPLQGAQAGSSGSAPGSAPAPATPSTSKPVSTPSTAAAK